MILPDDNSIINIEVSNVEEIITLYVDETIENTSINILTSVENNSVTIEEVREDTYLSMMEEVIFSNTFIQVENPEEEVYVNIFHGGSSIQADFLATEGYTKILNLPSEFPPTPHVHTIQDITNLEISLDDKADLINGKVNPSQLPIQQAGILEFPSFNFLPQPGSPGTLYITSDDDGQYRWKNGMYVSLFVLKDRTFVHEQGVPSNIWNIQHDLNKYPSVTIMDYYGNEYDGDITHVNINNIIIEFSLPFNGIATLN